MTKSPLLDRPTRDTEDSTDLVNDHGWPQGLCLVQPEPGKFACNVADTEGLEAEPQHDVHGLAVFASEGSAKLYTGAGALNTISGEIVPKTFDECRQIAIERPKLIALFLMEGTKIKDMVYVR